MTKPPTMASITAEVAALYGLPAFALRKRTRIHKISRPRQHATAIMAEQKRADGTWRYSWKQIADYFDLSRTTASLGARAHWRRNSIPAPR